VGTDKRVVVVTTAGEIQRLKEPVALTTPVLSDNGTKPVWIEAPTGGGGGNVATDTIWDAKGDLAAGTGANTAAKLTAGADDTILMADSAQTTGLKWVASQTPSTQAFGDAAAQGTADTYARGDHKHAMPSSPSVPSFATPAIALGTAAAAGAAGTVIRSDSTIAAFDATAPTTQAFGDSAATGSAAVAARRDHKHAMPSERAAASTAPAAIGTAAVGVGTTDARADHVHATGAGTPSTQAFGDSAATGTGPAAAMTDHKHAMPADPVTAHAAAADPHTGYVLESLLDAKGDLIAASADNTPIKLTVGADDTILMADAAAASGLKWVASASPSAVGTAAATGTADTFTRGDHVHAHETAHLAHDTLWDAAGDLVQGTGLDTAAKLAITVPAANILNVLGVVNGESSWSVKSVHDGTAPAAVGTAAAGTALTSAHRDHVHATGAGTPSTQAFADAAATGSGPAAAMTDHKHAMPTLGYGHTGNSAPAVSLTTASAFATSTGAASSAAYADVPGCTFNLVAGTWMIFGQCFGAAANSAFLMHVAITDSSNTILSEGSQYVAASGTASVNAWGCVVLHAIVSPGSTTQYKMRAARGNTTLTNTWTVQDGSGVGVTNNASDNTDKGSGIFALRIA
jgi:hypothetical protein